MHTIRAMSPSGIRRFSRKFLAKPTKLVDTVTTPPKRLLTQPFARIVAVGALTLLLTGSVATTAEARANHPAQKLVDLCFQAGGDPYYFEYWGVWAVACEWPAEENSRDGVDSKRAVVDDAGTGAADATDRGRQKANKQQEHKHHAGKHGHKHRR